MGHVPIHFSGSWFALAVMQIITHIKPHTDILLHCILHQHIQRSSNVCTPIVFLEIKGKCDKFLIKKKVYPNEKQGKYIENVLGAKIRTERISCSKAYKADFIEKLKSDINGNTNSDVAIKLSIFFFFLSKRNANFCIWLNSTLPPQSFQHFAVKTCN